MTKNIEELKAKANDLTADARDLTISIQESIINLETYGTSDHHIKLPTALKEAKMYYEDISRKAKEIPDAKDVTKCVNEQFDFWNEELKATEAQKDRLEKLVKEKEIFHNRLNDFKNLTHKVFRDSSETEAYITKNKNDLERLKEKVSQLETDANEVDELLDGNLIASSASRMDSIRDNFEKCKATSEDLMILHGHVDNALTERKADIEALKGSTIIEAERHAKDLSDRSKVIVGLFQHSKDGAQLAVRAGTAYSKISESIEAAKEAANVAYEAAVSSNKQLNPEDSNEETMLEKGQDLASESEDIQKDAEEQIEKINGKFKLSF